MGGIMRFGRRVAFGLAVLGALALLSACIPFRLGGPGSVYGNDPTRAGTQPGFWAAINGPYTNRADGDPYSTRCAAAPVSATSCSGAPNPDFDPSGYVYAIGVPAADVGRVVTVQIYDPAIGPNANLHETVQFAGFATSYRLFNTTGSPTIDLSPANALDVLGRCTAGTPGRQVFAPGPGPTTDAWYSLCTFTPTAAGIYPLQVRSSAIPGVADAGGGWNAFSVRATVAGGPQPLVYPVAKTSVWLPQASPVASVYLGQLGPDRAGKKLDLEFYDVGDGTAGSVPFTIQVLAPPSGSAVVPTGGSSVPCAYNSAPSAVIGAPTPDVSATCTIMTLPPNSSSGIYNGKWLHVSVTIPTTYTCTTDCFWFLRYSFGPGGTPTDRVTWIMNVSF